MADLNVNIRLNSDQVQADAQKAAEKAQKVLKTPPVLGGGKGGGGIDDSRLKQQATKFNQNMTSLMMPMFNPKSMWANFVASRQVYGAMMSEHGAGVRAGSMGGMGAGAATALLVGGAAAVGSAFKAMKTIIDGVNSSMEAARKNYAKSLTSGMGLGTSTMRGTLAGIMGVDEKEIMRFGKAMEYLRPKIKEATDTIAKTTPNLTSVAWEFDVMKLNLQALYATIANDAAPAIRALVSALSQLAIVAKFAWKFSGKGIIEGLSNVAFGPINTLLAKLMMKVFGGMAAPMTPIQPRQLPTSSWEKMGMIVGGGGGTNYNEKTAKNTGITNTILKQIQAALRGQNQENTAGYGTVPAIP